MIDKAKLKDADLRGYEQGRADALSKRRISMAEIRKHRWKSRTEEPDPYIRAFDKGYRRGWSDGATLHNQQADEEYWAKVAEEEP